MDLDLDFPNLLSEPSLTRLDSQQSHTSQQSQETIDLEGLDVGEDCREFLLENMDAQDMHNLFLEPSGNVDDDIMLLNTHKTNSDTSHDVYEGVYDMPDLQSMNSSSYMSLGTLPSMIDAHNTNNNTYINTTTTTTTTPRGSIVTVPTMSSSGSNGKKLQLLYYAQHMQQSTSTSTSSMSTTTSSSISNIIPTSPEDQAELIATNATLALRHSGMLFIEQESGSINSIEDFRSAFYGNDGDTSFDSDNEDDTNALIDDEGNGTDSKNTSAKKRKRNKRPNNPDADLIENATEEQMSVLGIDPSGREGKRQRRRIRNRMSAQLHRERKKLYIDALEAFVRVKDTRIKSLEYENTQLKTRLGLGLGLQRGQRQAPTQHDYSGESTLGCSSGSVHEGESDSISATTTTTTTTTTKTSRDRDSDSHSELSMSPSHNPSMDIEGGETEREREREEEMPRRASKRNRKEGNSATATSTSTSTSGSTLITGNKGMRAFLPLLSVICLICLTAFTNNSGSTSISTSTSTIVSTSSAEEGDSFHRMLLEAPSSDTEYPLDTYKNTPEADNINESDSISKALTPIQSVNTVHSTPPMTTFISHYENKNMHRGSGRGSGRALWAYPPHHLLLDLYPRYTLELEKSVPLSPLSTYHTGNVMTSGSSGSSVNNSILGLDWMSYKDTTSPPKRHLRKRSSTSTSTSGVEVDSKAIVPITHTHTEPPLSHTHTHSNRDSTTSVSRVLMSSGKALLDPKMTNMITICEKGESVGDKDSGSSSTSTNSPHMRIGTNPNPTTNPDSTTDPDANVLFMLVPASSVRWGSDWDSSLSVGSTESLYKALSNDTTSSEGGEQEQGELYVELGVSIFKAQLVRDVNTK